ncbi:hypothetical protein DF16_pBMB293orf00235 (plasmid) [Bacillus thuringiensis serovar kurstaki str. YBT-1520]|nr:hypothetical protein DF16_pBMB293orf00235 [Bacillus thuringiensis serovar kurstaki str. YBT-1520]
MIVTDINLLNSKIIRIEASYDRITLELMDIIHKKEEFVPTLLF